MLGMTTGDTALVLIVASIFVVPAMLKQLMRTIRVLARGWPPAHLDIDGKFHPDVEITQEEMR